MSDDTSPLPLSLARHILVADDEPIIRTVLRRVLEQRGHRVTTAPDVPTAIDLLNSHRFDAVLADAKMPGDGITILKHVDAMGFKGVRVLMTGGSAADDAVMSAGVYLLQKPFRFQAVIPLVEGEAS